MTTSLQVSKIVFRISVYECGSSPVPCGGGGYQVLDIVHEGDGNNYQLC